MSESLASRISFKELCDLFERIQRLRPAQKYEELKKFFKKYRDMIPGIKKDYPNADLSLFPVVRLLLPNYDKNRGSYGLKETALANLYIRVFPLRKNSDEAQALKNYTAPMTNSDDSGRDFGETVYKVLKTLSLLPGKESTFTVAQINAFLDEVAEKNKMNENKEKTFKALVHELSLSELKWITRIILKDLKLGNLGRKKIFEAFHSEAEEFFTMKSNLREVCDKLTDLTVKIKPNDMKIELFFHFKPMLLERYKIEKANKLFQSNDNRYFVQIKYDGERSQIHMKDGRFKYITRNGIDITGKSEYGATKDSGGFLTRNIASLLKKDCRSVILDGELMGWNKEKKCFGSKGMSFDVKNLGESTVHQPCFVAYDVILYNDELLIEKPYHERLNILNTLFQEKEGVMVKCTSNLISGSNELLKVFNDSLENNEEGIVLKKYDCTYKPNVREKGGCYKIKAEYSENLIQDIDMLILGAYYGEGRWTGLLNSFLVGITVPDTNPPQFHSVVRVASGIKHNVLQNLQEKFRNKWKKNCPSNVTKPKVKSMLPNFWLDPQDSLVLQLRATEITKTNDYTFGYTLRFPRVSKIRDDKPWSDVCTTTEFLSLLKDKGMVQKLTKRHATFEDLESTPVSKASRNYSNRLPVSKINERNLGIRGSDITRLTRLLHNKEFCVINGNDELSKNDVEKLLYQHGAKVVQNPRKECFCLLVGDKNTLKAKNQIQAKQSDVVTLDWLKRATRQENWSKLVEFYPWELLACKPSTKKRIDKIYDDMGDSFTEDANLESLKRSFEKIEEMIEDDDSMMIDPKELDKEIFGNDASPFSVFRGKVGHFLDPEDVEQNSFRFMRGIVAEDVADATYIFVNNKCAGNPIETESNLQTVVESRWVEDCFLQRELLPVSDYLFCKKV